MYRRKRDVELLVRNRAGAKQRLVRLFMENGELVPPFQEIVRKGRVPGDFRRDSHAAVKPGQQGDHLRNQNRRAGAQGDGALFPVKFPNLLNHGVLLKQQVAGIFYRQFSVFI